MLQIDIWIQLFPSWKFTALYLFWCGLSSHTINHNFCTLTDWYLIFFPTFYKNFSFVMNPWMFMIIVQLWIVSQMSWGKGNEFWAVTNQWKLFSPTPQDERKNAISVSYDAVKKEISTFRVTHILCLQWHQTPGSFCGGSLCQYWQFRVKDWHKSSKISHHRTKENCQ